MGLNFRDMPAAPWPRPELRAALLKHVPADRVDEVVDLACHAADSARHQLFAVADRAFNPSVKMAALTLGLSLLISEAERMRQVISNVAEATPGMKIFEEKVEVNHGQ